MMRKLLCCAILIMASTFFVNAQTSADVVKILEEKYGWARARVIEETVTVNGPGEMFDRILSDKRSFDISTFSYLSVYLGKYFDKVYGTDIIN